jgi:hypothetical protein
MINPYASHLGDRDPRAVIAATPSKLSSFIDTSGSLGPGKWTPREILCHLADCEIVFAFRLRQALAEPHHIIQPFDQDNWAKVYSAFDARAALEVFTTVRKWNITLIDALPSSAFSKTLQHPERGEMTFQVVIETMGGHDLNHLQQLERIASLSAAH